MPTQPSHGRQIAAARAILGFTLQDLADAAGLHRQSIVYNEKRKQLPRYGRAAGQIAEAVEPLGIKFVTLEDGQFAVAFRAPGKAIPAGRT